MLFWTAQRLKYDTTIPHVLLFPVEGVKNYFADVSETTMVTNIARDRGKSHMVISSGSRFGLFSGHLTPEVVSKDVRGSEQLTLDDTLERSMRAAASVLCDSDVTSIELLTSLWDIGMSSIRAVSLSSVLEEEFGIKLPASIAFDYGTVSDLAGFIHREYFTSSRESIFKDSSQSLKSERFDISGVLSKRPNSTVANLSTLPDTKPSFFGSSSREKGVGQELGMSSIRYWRMSDTIRHNIFKIFSEYLPDLQEHDHDPESLEELSLWSIGLSSVTAVQLVTELSEALHLELPSTLLFDHPTIAAVLQTIEAQDDQCQRLQILVLIEPRCQSRI